MTQDYRIREERNPDGLKSTFYILEQCCLKLSSNLFMGGFTCSHRQRAKWVQRACKILLRPQRREKAMSEDLNSDVLPVHPCFAL